MQILGNQNTCYCICYYSKSCKLWVTFTPAMLYDTSIWTDARSRLVWVLSGTAPGLFRSGNGCCRRGWLKRWEHFPDTNLWTRKRKWRGYTYVLLCPMASWQKGRLEKNHEFIRYTLPKGSCFSGLTQEATTRVANHINSIWASLNGHTPFELAQMLIW